MITQSSRVMILIASILVTWLSTTSGQTIPPPPPANSESTLNPKITTLLAPPLVAEGVYAIKLIDILKLSHQDDTGKAEAVLSGFGIEPKNGWITEYPITPAVLGEIDQQLLDAINQNRIKLDKQLVLQQIGELKDKLGLASNGDGNSATAAKPDSSKPNSVLSIIYSYSDKQGNKTYTDNYQSIPSEYRQHVKIVRQTMLTVEPNSTTSYTPAKTNTNLTSIPNNETISDYYSNQGPPIVTYFPPPTQYVYLYNWVPYPFWSTGWYFSGFFVLNDFYRRVGNNHQQFVVSNHHHHHNDSLNQNPVNLTTPISPAQQLSNSANVLPPSYQPPSPGEQLHQQHQNNQIQQNHDNATTILPPSYQPPQQGEQLHQQHQNNQIQQNHDNAIVIQNHLIPENRAESNFVPQHRLIETQHNHDINTLIPNNQPPEFRVEQQAIPEAIEPRGLQHRFEPSAPAINNLQQHSGKR